MIGAPHAHTKILIVDDEPDIVEEMIEQLEYQGLSCLSAFNAKSALDMVNTDPEIGVIVTDIRMPGMDGLEMARQMKTSAGPERDLYIIVVTGHAGMKEAIEALQLGAEDFLTKPISPDHLLHSIRRGHEMIHLRQHERNFQQQLKLEVQMKTAELDAANQVKDQFLSVMGHELRTPLNAINGFTELLQHQLKTKGLDALPLEEYFENILHSGKRLQDTIENILEFSSTISGKRDVKPEWHNLDDVFSNVVNVSQRQAMSKDIRLERASMPQDQRAEIDSKILTKALMCLVDNAVKFSPAGSAVTLGAQRTADSLTFFVKDHGCGMTADEITLARQPFNQIDSGLNRLEEGSGLGLSLAALLSELHGGRLDIDSTPGVGTTASIVLADT